MLQIPLAKFQQQIVILYVGEAASVKWNLDARGLHKVEAERELRIGVGKQLHVNIPVIYRCE